MFTHTYMHSHSLATNKQTKGAIEKGVKTHTHTHRNTSSKANINTTTRRRNNENHSHRSKNTYGSVLVLGLATKWIGEW
jgi:hypothetical protein